MIKKKELHHVKITSLKPYTKNPRKNDKAAETVAKSLKEYGLVKNSIVVDENMEVITGHTTIKAMQILGWLEVPEITQVSGLTDLQKKGYRIADNRTGEDAEWDDYLLTGELQGLGDLFTGFDPEEFIQYENELLPYELEDLIEELDVKGAIEDPVWVTIRASGNQINEIERALEGLNPEIHIEKSYRKER